MTETDTMTRISPHHHVEAVQDSGGSQEHWTDWREPMTLEVAGALAAEIADADMMINERGALDEAIARYGDRLPGLISGNVAPGYDVIRVVPCDGACQVTR